MTGGSPNRSAAAARSARVLRYAVFAAAVAALGACTSGGRFEGEVAPPVGAPAGAPPPVANIGTGQVKVALILPLSAGGNAGAAAQSMRNAAELALAEFNNPNIQLLVKDDAGSAGSAQGAAQQAVDEGAELIIGPLFAQSVPAVAGVARGRGIPVIAFSNDANVASRGVYLLSFLPESDVNRIVDYAAQNGKRSFAALLPDNAYGSVVEGALQTAASRRGGRVVALERYSADPTRMQEAARRVAEAAKSADAIFIPSDEAPTLVQTLQSAGVNTKRAQLLGSGLWDDPRISTQSILNGGWYPAPETSGWRAFAGRYRAKFGSEPVRTATFAYDAVALVAALVKTQGAQRFSEQVLTNPSGFAGIDGVFRFRSDGTNERGLAVMRATPSGGQPIAPAPKSFGSGA